MRIILRDLECLFSDGPRFEQLLFDLVTAEGRRHGIPAAAILWDPRTTVADGGRDIIVSRSHSDDVDFIPRRPSVWSAKSGKNDLTKARLVDEITAASRENLQAHLSSGGIYVLCTPRPVKDGLETTLREAFLGITRPDGTPAYQSDQFVFYSASTLLNILNRDTGLAASCFPHVAATYNGCITVSEWEPTGTAGARVPFVAVGGRDDLINRIREHLRARSGPSVLHIGGLSGVGKTRTVFEAIHGQHEFKSALYLERFTPDTLGLIDKLKSRQSSCMTLIVDEFPIEQLSNLIEKCGSDPQLRVVSIGPVRRGERFSSENVVTMPEPDTTTEVLPIVDQAGSGLDRKVLRSIAEQSAHDLRLALLLVKATQRSADSIDLPLHDGAGLWSRICQLFRRDIDGVKDFERIYPLLTLAIDIGYHDLDRSELESLADFFGVSWQDLHAVVGRAVSVGLGHSSLHFFEAIPRALAIHLFQREVFDHVYPRFADLLKSVPHRLRRRIVERCQELTGVCREKVDEAITSFFQGELGGKEVTQLTSTTAARIFKAWAELDPRPALRWLRDCLESATEEQIAALDGRDLLYRGPSPRRQLVWLCEGMAAFGEHFANSEAILFNLWGVETERGIGNNSIGVWKGLFLPVLAFTEVPFPARARLLLDRLRDTTPQKADVVVDAVMGALATHFGGRCAPPHVVGGYLTPPQWMPKTAAELREFQVDLATQYLAVAERLPADIRVIAMEKAVNHLGAFHRLGVLGQLQTLLKRFGKDLWCQAKKEASELIVFHDVKEVEGDGGGPGSLSELLAFEKDLSPTTLLERIEDVATRDTWDVAKRKEWDATNESGDPYAELASLLASTPLVLAQCEPLFSSELVRSDAALGMACGARDDADVFVATAEAWLQAGVCGGFLSGFLQGIARRCGCLPPRWSHQLDQVARAHPQLVADLTLSSEQSETGLSRLLVLLRRGQIRPASTFRLAFNSWTGAVELVGKAEVVNGLLHVPHGARAESLTVALKLGQVWGSFGKAPFSRDLSTVFVTVLAHTLGGTSETDAWVDVLTSLGRSEPIRALDLAAQALVRKTSGYGMPSELLLPLLKELSTAHPTEAMKLVGELLLEPTHSQMFGVLKFDGLFDAIGVDAVRAWIKDKNSEVVALIARHLNSPSVESGCPVVPPVTEWLFQEYWMDTRIFDAFCAGRHAFEIQVGTARDRRAALNALVEPFRHDNREWVRKWAEYEERLNKAEERWDAIDEENMERR